MVYASQDTLIIKKAIKRKCWQNQVWQNRTIFWGSTAVCLRMYFTWIWNSFSQPKLKLKPKTKERAKAIKCIPVQQFQVLSRGFGYGKEAPKELRYLQVTHKQLLDQLRIK